MIVDGRVRLSFRMFAFFVDFPRVIKFGVLPSASLGCGCFYCGCVGCLFVCSIGLGLGCGCGCKRS